MLLLVRESLVAVLRSVEMPVEENQLLLVVEIDKPLTLKSEP